MMAASTAKACYAIVGKDDTTRARVPWSRWYRSLSVDPGMALRLKDAMHDVKLFELNSMRENFQCHAELRQQSLTLRELVPHHTPSLFVMVVPETLNDSCAPHRRGRTVPLLAEFETGG